MLAIAKGFQIDCETQDALDYYRERLAGRDPNAQQCGWLKDRYGVSWQVVPRALIGMLSDPAYEKSQCTMQAMLKMKKLDIAGLRRGYAG